MAETEADWAEKRNAIRQRTLKQGRIAIKGVSTMDCMIRNMSLTGARLAVSNASSLPDTFTLFIGSEGMKRDCEVMSRTGNSAGVRFTKALTPHELGAEFMRASASSNPPAEAREALAPPALAAPDPSTLEPGVTRVAQRPLPAALRKALPW